MHLGRVRDLAKSLHGSPVSERPRMIRWLFHACAALLSLELRPVVLHPGVLPKREIAHPLTQVMTDPGDLSDRVFVTVSY